MKLLTEARKRLAERRYYGRAETEEYIERQFETFNNLPPTRMAFCPHCGAPVIWRRETPGFSTKTGRPGHSYHLTCENWGKSHWHDQRTGEIWYQYEPPFRSSKVVAGPRLDVPVDDERVDDLKYHIGFSDIGCSHYDSHEYRWREGDRDSYDREELW